MKVHKEYDYSTGGTLKTDRNGNVIPGQWTPEFMNTIIFGDGISQELSEYLESSYCPKCDLVYKGPRKRCTQCNKKLKSDDEMAEIFMNE